MNVINFQDANCAHCYKCLRNCDVKQSVSNKDRRRLLQICVFTVDTVWKYVLRRRKAFDSDLAIC